LEDPSGRPLSPKSDAAAADYVAAVDLMLWSNAGVKALFDRALSAVSDFALAHITRTRLLHLAAQKGGPVVGSAGAQREPPPPRRRATKVTPEEPS
jgi:hypothetical protein